MKVQNRKEANAIILERLRYSYDKKLNVEFLVAELETDLANDKRF